MATWDCDVCQAASDVGSDRCLECVFRGTARVGLSVVRWVGPVLLLAVPVLGWAGTRPGACPAHFVIERQKVEPQQGLAHDGFGAAVALSGRVAAIGAPGSNEVYIYERVSGRWMPGPELRAPGSVHYFGDNVALSGNLLAVRGKGIATSRAHSGNHWVVYVFRQVREHWIQVARLTPPPGVGNGNFGFALAVSGTTVFVGAELYDHYKGAVYVFTDRDGRWVRTRLTPHHWSPHDVFGVDLAVWGGSWLAVGAPYQPRGKRVGRIDLFRLIHGRWVEFAGLREQPGSVGGGFGFPLAAAGRTLVAADLREGGGRGVYVFRWTGVRWRQVEKITGRSYLRSLMEWIGVSGRCIAIETFGWPTTGRRVAASKVWNQFTAEGVVSRRGGPRRVYSGVVIHLLRRIHGDWCEGGVLRRALRWNKQVSFRGGLTFGQVEPLAISSNWLALGAVNKRTHKEMVYFYRLGR
ncbi:MAG: FG-GAP repeat protein [Gammaproteobacteria bacterium]